MEYKKLPKNVRAIRLLRVFSSPDRDELIRSTLELRKLESPGVYRALSYVWGDPQDTGSIYINDVEVAVTKTVVSALKHLRPRASKSALVIWIYAVCINQKDHHEKNQQVPLMSDIYTKGTEVSAG